MNFPSHFPPTLIVADTNEKYYLYKLERNPNDSVVLHGYAAYLASKDRLIDAEKIYRHLLSLPFHGRQLSMRFYGCMRLCLYVC